MMVAASPRIYGRCPKEGFKSRVTSIAICQLLDLVRSEKLEVRNQEGAHNSYSAPIPPYYIKQFVHHLYKTPRRFLILCAVPSLLTPHSSLDSEVDLNASYLENAILVT